MLLGWSASRRSSEGYKPYEIRHKCNQLAQRLFKAFMRLRISIILIYLKTDIIF